MGSCPEARSQTGNQNPLNSAPSTDSSSLPRQISSLCPGFPTENANDHHSCLRQDTSQYLEGALGHFPKYYSQFLALMPLRKTRAEWHMETGRSQAEPRPASDLFLRPSESGREESSST